MSHAEHDFNSYRMQSKDCFVSVYEIFSILNFILFSSFLQAACVLRKEYLKIMTRGQRGEGGW